VSIIGSTCGMSTVRGFFSGGSHCKEWREFSRETLSDWSSCLGKGKLAISLLPASLSLKHLLISYRTTKRIKGLKAQSKEHSHCTYNYIECNLQISAKTYLSELANAPPVVASVSCSVPLSDPLHLPSKRTATNTRRYLRSCKWEI
jgi:hypothetical protein